MSCKISLIGRRFRSVRAAISLCFASFLALALAIAWSPPASAQLQNLFQKTAVEEGDTSIPAYDCAYRLVCAELQFDGQSLFTVVAEPSLNPNEARILPVRQRVTAIQNELLKIATSGANANTLRVELGTFHDEIVVLAPTQPKIEQRIIVTVTQLDAAYYNKTALEVAQTWKTQIQRQLQDSLRDRRSWQNKLPEVGRNLVGMMAIAFFLNLMQHLLKKRSYQLRQEIILSDVKPMDQGDVGVSATSQMASAETTTSTLTPQFQKHWTKLQPQAHPHLTEILHFGVHKLLHLSAKRRYSLIRLLQLLMFWGQLFNVFIGIGLCLFLFPETRTSGEKLMGAPLMLMLLWLGVSLGARASAFVVDWQLEKWLKQSVYNIPQYCQRHTIRVDTYSTALKDIVNKLLYGLGIFKTIDILLQVLLHTSIAQSFAGLGIVGIILTLIFQNTIKDAISGCLILLYDYFAVGDVIAINNQDGAVEYLNLFYTQLRNTRGHLITLPNRNIDTIVNMTQSWSRVTFEIAIAHDIDLKPAMKLLLEIVDQMRSESEWQERIIEPAQMRGLYDISSAGARVGIWIKTQPGQQWNVEYEFRLRVKQAFELQGIALSIPEQAFVLKPSPNPIK